MDRIKNKIKDALEKVLDLDYGHIVPLEGMEETYMVRAALDGAKEAIIFSTLRMTTTTYLGAETIADCDTFGVPIREQIAQHLFEQYIRTICRWAWGRKTFGTLYDDGDIRITMKGGEDKFRIEIAMKGDEDKFRFWTPEREYVVDYGASAYDMAEDLLAKI